MEETRNSQVESWSNIETGTKQDGSVWHRRDMKFNNEKFKIGLFGGLEELSKLNEKYPVGSYVSYKVWKKDDDKYWKYKKDTLKLNTDQTKLTNNIMPKKNEQFEDNRQNMIVRQNALAHADELIKMFNSKGLLENADVEYIMSLYFNLAKKCEEWVYRNEKAAVKEETLKVTEERVTNGS